MLVNLPPNCLPGLDPGSPLLCKKWIIWRKSGCMAKLNNLFSCFLGEGGFFFGEEIFPTHPTLLRVYYGTLDVKSFLRLLCPKLPKIVQKGQSCMF
jgi:hypothetical protein